MNDIKIKTVIEIATRLETILKNFFEEHKSNSSRQYKDIVVFIQGMLEGFQQFRMWINEEEQRGIPLGKGELIKLLSDDIEGVEWNLEKEYKEPDSLSKNRTLNWRYGNKLIYQILIAVLSV